MNNFEFIDFKSNSLGSSIIQNKLRKFISQNQKTFKNSQPQDLLFC